jgi:hypothetical protein
MDPLEWLARMADHIPNPRKHRTLFYGYMPIECAEIAPRSSRERARLKRSRPTSAGVPRVGRV